MARAPSPRARRAGNQPLSVRAGLRLVVMGAVALCLFVVYRRIDWAATRASLTGLGWGAAGALLPYFAVLLCDCSAWSATFAESRHVRLSLLLRIRVASEAIAGSVPAGVAVAEAFKALALQRRVGLPVADAIANGVVSKAALTVAHALFLVVGLVLARPTLRASSQRLIGRPGLDDIGTAGAWLFLALVCAAVLLLARRPWLQRLGASGSSGRVPPRRLLRAVALFFGGWTAMALETWVLLGLLSIPVPFTTAISIEAVVSIVKVVFFFIPSGLGAQEASYYLLLRMYGVPNPEVVASAFVIVKRTKELVWMGVGYGAFSTMNVGRAAPRERVPRALTRAVASVVNP